MKNYKEMANDVIRRIDEYQTAYKRKKTIITYTATALYLYLSCYSAWLWVMAKWTANYMAFQVILT